MDEPFINLDIALKFSLIDRIKSEQSQNPKTVVFITHDIKEAVSLADRIVLIKDSNIVYDNSKINDNTENEIFNVMLKMKEIDR